MKKLAGLLLAVLSVGLLSACMDLVQTATLAEPLSLKIGQTVDVAGENMRVTFQQVTEDSRCPSGVVCIWAGQATSLVKIVYANTAYMLSLTEIGSGQAATQDFLDYKITFDLLPYPVAGKTANQGDYRLMLTITK